ncbi:MAG TPA: outer membrane protein assembly factor BamD [Ideonella sp.]|jgi:outer membrane protein assembly factor BamD|nr:outer membrane protein assembly factor BamD [Ideonella sp.]
MIHDLFRRPLMRAALVSLAVLLAGCSSFFNKDDGDIQGSGEKLYEEAKADMAAGGWLNAIKKLERVEGRAGGTLLAQQSQLDLAYANWKAGEKATAISVLDRFVKLNPSSPGLDYALYLRGLINFNDDSGLLGVFANQKLSERDQQASRDAYTSFKQLVEQFPESRYTPDAKLRMDYIVNALADYEVHVARYYLRRGAYIAAANRAQQAVTVYPQTPAIEEALYIMGRAYDKLGLAELRDDADRVLKTNFPQSPFIAGTGPGQDKPWWQFWDGNKSWWQFW